MKILTKILALSLLCGTMLFGQRIKDLSYFKGVQTQQLIGYGLVVGLSGSGDSYRSLMTEQSVRSMLKRFGVTITEKNLRTRNVAAVMVTANISNLLKPGANFDVIVSSLGDASSLMGGSLLMTPLSGLDGSVFGVAQGPVSIGGYDINTSSGGRVARNVALTGRIPNGAVLDKELPGGELNKNEISVMLREPDFTTINNMAVAINKTFGDGTAETLGAAEVKVKVPAQQQTNFGAFLAQLEAIQITKDAYAKVVINERTGTIVSGEFVRIAPVTISHGGLNITIRSFPIISQPNAFSNGETTTFNNLVPTVQQESNNTIAIQGASNVQEVAAALNSLKVSPRDMIAIFQALKEAGALTADLVII
ncbi:MAG: flagellar basal body P-ring protein FlgI [Chlorobi bacterium]|nr:flagellar basal body P-ring protein FlgI [Chlorobiota bacterium]